MISAKLLLSAVSDLEDILDVHFIVYNHAGECIYGPARQTDAEFSAVSRFIGSAAETMVINDTYFFKVLESERAEYVIEAGGSNAELGGRLAVSEIRHMLAVADAQTDRSLFMQNVLLDNFLSTDMHAKAKKLKIREYIRRIVYLVEVTPDRDNTAHQVLKAVCLTTKYDVFVTPVDSRHLAVIQETDPDETETQFRQQAEVFLDTLNAEAMIPAYISYGNPASSLSTLSQSYKEAQLAMTVGQIFKPDQRISSYNSLGIGRLIYQLPPSLCNLFLKETFDHDIFQELDDETMLTIRHFFDNNLNISETARQLYIHRNTLVYRLERLQKTTGLDIRKFDEAMTFKIAMLVHDCLMHQKEM